MILKGVSGAARTNGQGCPTMLIAWSMGERWRLQRRSLPRHAREAKRGTAPAFFGLRVAT